MEKYRALIVGSGAAGYAAAERLLRLGIRDIGILTEDKNAGTSRNAGSDKQTYYRLSCTEEDSFQKMAAALMGGYSMHADAAMVEAANSLPCFLRLAELGVPFPTDEWGRFVDYRTDHDAMSRGASAGPLTSRCMTETLEKLVLADKRVTLIDKALLVKILKEGNRQAGVLALKKTPNGYELAPIGASYLVIAAGGPATVYENTVYPGSQTGALGILAEAGCRLNNITEWQYGLASLEPRWNVSGSYQQVVPTYFSRTPQGRETEFLPVYFHSPAEAYGTVFQKGYHWPFDSRRLDGTSKIDLAVSRELSGGRRVFMDFRKNPEGFDFERLPDEAKAYLLSADAAGAAPYERLCRLNPQAADFYRERGVNLSAGPLEIALCAQHHNGGADVDVNWQTNIKNLFVIGEAAGVFGLYRPGGSALNDTQVGALRAAQYIARQSGEPDADGKILEAAAREERAYIKRCLMEKEPIRTFGADMSRYAGPLRVLEEIGRIYREADAEYRRKYYGLPEDSYEAVKRLYTDKNTLAAQRILCKTFLETLPETGSRGGAVCFKDGALLREDAAYRSLCVHTENDEISFAPLRRAEFEDRSFEAVWREFRARQNAEY